MERVLLYYPTIEFPEETWIRQAILYSDKVSSILPFGKESELPNSLKELLDRGEYKPIFVEEHINEYYEDFRRFSSDFLRDIDNDPRIFTASSLKPRTKKVDSLFRNKMTGELIYELERRHLITLSNDRKIFLPENIALYYMAGLAKFVASNPTMDLITPSTDYKRFSTLTFENGIGNDKALNLILMNCLPVPDENVDLSKIIEFKKTHKSDLTRFRHTYTSTQEVLRNCRDPKDATEAMIIYKEKIGLELDTLNKLYKKNKINTIFTTLDSLFGLENPKLFETLMSVGLISATIDPKIGMGLGLIMLSSKIINNHLSRQKPIGDFNYLFEAKAKGIIK
jgi:hypothetical protein